MKFNGIDTAAKISAEQAQKLKAEGVSFVGRYLVPATGTTAWKALSEAEARAIREAGLALLLIWETSPARVKGGQIAGKTDATMARALAEAMHVPSGTVIVFAADYNVQPDDYAAVHEYLYGASCVLSPYQVGLYGHEKIVNEMAARSVCCYFMQCVAWSNQFSWRANVIQYAWQGDQRAKAVEKKVGFAVDLCAADSLSQMWGPIEPAPWYEDTMRWAIAEGIVTEERPLDKPTRAEVLQMFRNYDRRFEPEDKKSDSGLLSD